MTNGSFDVVHHFYENNGDAAADSSTQYGFSEASFGHFTGFEAFSGSVSTTGDEDWVTASRREQSILPDGNRNRCHASP